MFRDCDCYFSLELIKYVNFPVRYAIDKINEAEEKIFS